MNTLKLKQFITLAELLNMSKAASALYISQPALSQSIASLESELGCQLFDRVNKKLILNEQGQLALTYARDLVAKADEMKTAIAVSLSAQRCIRITTDIYIMYSMLSASYMLDNPTSNTLFVPRRGSDFSSLLLNKQTDAVISTMPLDNNDIVSIKLFTTPQYALVPQESTFYGATSVSLEELKDLPFFRNKDVLSNSSIFYDNTSGTVDSKDELIKSIGIVEHYVDFNSMRLMWNTKDHGFFLSPMTMMAVPELRILDPARFVRLKNTEFEKAFYLSVLKNSSAHAKSFLDWFQSPDNEFWTRYHKVISTLMHNDKQQ